jgi:hypothetical protein
MGLPEPGVPKLCGHRLMAVGEIFVNVSPQNKVTRKFHFFPGEVVHNRRRRGAFKQPLPPIDE